METNMWIPVKWWALFVVLVNIASQKRAIIEGSADFYLENSKDSFPLNTTYIYHSPHLK
jgi:hypothetical protein